jgi:hypothetical protein
MPPTKTFAGLKKHHSVAFGIPPLRAAKMTRVDSYTITAEILDDVYSRNKNCILVFFPSIMGVNFARILPKLRGNMR